ncbi:MAG: HU family DNA-binding protein [Firmicutes bacterium]|uniref:Transcriptional regulator n=1 Tax=Kroppenstedtia guangzhouensis TaxID=1274356 RepID=A0ABQ1GN45_9BACL|nr:HU family DNA-binding protein [Kroppenstedtia guangzhouensis]EGK10226.1 DNA-binding protein HU [Desmospora sp. 8437]MDA8353655.1 HU family DNA-binding protein [Bacillota bacterium]GGA47091.1 transcriptional regulator [Kroppenstedtia guangzhouensis]
MNKTELTKRVAQETGKSKTEAGQMVDVVLDQISEALQRGEKVSLFGFGNFEVRERAARMARNPKTGETIHVEAKRIPAFKPGKQLKEVVNG